MAELGLEQEYLFDAWGGKISYIFLAAINNLFQKWQDFPRASNLKCWIDLSAYNLLRMDQEFRVSNIYNKSVNNCYLTQDNLSKKPYYYSNFLSNRGGLLFTNASNMIFNNLSYDYLRQDYTIFLVSAHLQNGQVANSRIDILDEKRFLGDNDVLIKLDHNFISHIIGQNNNFILYEFLFFTTKLNAQEINSIKSYLSLKWHIKNNDEEFLNIKSQNGKLIIDNAILLLISHGKNSKGSFNSYGNQIFLEKMSKLEKENIYYLDSNNIFIEKLANDWQNDFDDILSYLNYLELTILSGN